MKVGQPRKNYFAYYYQCNKKKMDARTKKYYQDNPEVKLFANYNYRLKRKKDNGG